jgi:hypothetical protein
MAALVLRLVCFLFPDHSVMAILDVSSRAFIYNYFSRDFS